MLGTHAPFAGTSFALLLSLQPYRSLGRPLLSLRLCSPVPLLRGHNGSNLRLRLLAGSLAHSGHYSCSAWSGEKSLKLLLLDFSGSRSVNITNCSPLLALRLFAMPCCPWWAAPAGSSPTCKSEAATLRFYDLKTKDLCRRFCSFSRQPLCLCAFGWHFGVPSSQSVLV